MVKKSGPTGLPRGWAGLERMIENEKRERAILDPRRRRWSEAERGR